MATDLAIELVEKNEKEFVESSSCFKAELIEGDLNGPNYLFSGFALYKTQHEFYGAELMDFSSLKMYEIAETLCFLTFSGLRAYLLDLQPCQLTFPMNMDAKTSFLDEIELGCRQKRKSSKMEICYGLGIRFHDCAI